MTAFTARLLRRFDWTLPTQSFAPRLGRSSPTPIDELKVTIARL